MALLAGMVFSTVNIYTQIGFESLARSMNIIIHYRGWSSYFLLILTDFNSRLVSEDGFAEKYTGKKQTTKFVDSHVIIGNPPPTGFSLTHSRRAA